MKDTTVKFAVITGASKGIGFSVFRELTKRGWQVAGLSRTQGNLPRENWIQCDVTESESVRNALREALKKSEGRLDALILNAGMGIAGALEFTSEEDYRRQIEVNLTGTAYCAREGAAVMRRNGGGKMIFISSLAAIFPLPFQSFYSAGKAAVNALSDALGIELKPFGIRTCTVMLNDVRTEFTDNRIKNFEGDDIYMGRIEESVAKMEESERKGMHPEKVASAVCSLLRRKHMPSHKIVGAGNQILGILYRVLPADAMLWILGKIYG